MIKFGNTIYFIDFESIEKLISGKEDFKARDVIETERVITLDDKGEEIGTQVHERKYRKEQVFDAAKYDILVMMIETVMGASEEIDETLGTANVLSKQPLGFKLAFNTLINYNILREYKK